VSVAVRTSLTFARAYECVCVRACVRACVRVPRAAALSRARSQRRGAASSHERVVELTPGAAAAAAARDRDDDDGEDDLLVPYAAGFLPSPSLPECCLPACLPACLPVCLSVCLRVRLCYDGCQALPPAGVPGCSGYRHSGGKQLRRSRPLAVADAVSRRDQLMELAQRLPVEKARLSTAAAPPVVPARPPPPCVPR
jgi:hypothetical protein